MGFFLLSLAHSPRPSLQQLTETDRRPEFSFQSMQFLVWVDFHQQRTLSHYPIHSTSILTQYCLLQSHKVQKTLFNKCKQGEEQISIPTGIKPEQGSACLVISTTCTLTGMDLEWDSWLVSSDWENSGAYTHLLLSQTLRNPVQPGHGVLPPCLGTDAKKVVHHAGEISGLKFVLGG